MPLYFNDLEISNRDLEDGAPEDDELLATFDPRTETIAHATDRLLESLRPRVRRALEAIAARARDLNGAQQPLKLRRVTAFEGLLQYQGLSQSRNAISKALGAERAHVGREISRAAALVGLTLRKETGGWPPKRVLQYPDYSSARLRWPI